MNLAPVLDTPENLAIGSRAFSDDPRLIGQLASAFIVGQQGKGVATVAKHFPGEGRSHGDSHYQLPVRWEPAPAIRSELSPFCEAIQHDLDAVMTAHVAVPALARNRLPATMSPRLLTGVLRQELNFDGLILTDELEGMRSISAYGVERAAVAAINAGADMVFVAFSPDIQKRVHRALIEAIQSGQIPPVRVEQALARIGALKTKRKLFDSLPPLNERLAILQRKEGTKVAMEIARQSVTRLGPNTGVLPINASSRIALITDSDNFVQAIRARAPQTKVIMVDKQAMQNARATKRAIQESEASADAVIGAFISHQHLAILRSVTLSRPLVILLMNVPTPDFLRDIPKPQAVLVNYSYQPASAQAATTVLFENPVTPGILPVKAEPPQNAAITAKVQ
jgi:beta-N-acetylhexosaminidase